MSELSQWDVAFSRMVQAGGVCTVIMVVSEAAVN